MININLIRVIINILAENGETRLLTLAKLINTYTNNIKVEEPAVFIHMLDESKYIALPINSVKIDWGDGQITYSNKHTYEKQNIYRVKIYNSGSEVTIINGDCWSDYIINFISIGRIGIKTLSDIFYYNLLNFIIEPNWDVSRVTNMDGMFWNAEKFNRKFGDNWDTSNVVNMSYMFCGARNFNQKIGDNWDTSRVTDMSSMFSGASNFNQKIGDNWDTSKVTDMKRMFYSALKFNQKIGDNWDTSQVTDMSYMFCSAKNFNQKIGDNWDTTNVRNMHCMFLNACKLNQKIGNNWNISNSTNIVYMFKGTNIGQK